MNSLHRQLLLKTRTFLDRVEDDIVPAFTSGMDWAMDERLLEPSTLPCLRHLDSIALMEAGMQGGLSAFLARHHEAFRWGQTYTQADFGEDFIENYGWMELFGTRGHFVNDRIAGGFLILGPRLHYPDHHHLAEEIYIPLTGGTLWRKGEGAFAERPAGSAIHHPSNINHAMKTGDNPLMAFYLWRGGPLAERSTISVSASKV